jgi:hypothetical protein
MQASEVTLIPLRHLRVLPNNPRTVTQARRLYRIDKKIYKTREAFLKALEKFNPNNGE